MGTLSKECQARKSSAEAAQIQISELREELQQASTTLHHRAVIQYTLLIA